MTDGMIEGSTNLLIALVLRSNEGIEVTGHVYFGSQFALEIVQMTIRHCPFPGPGACNTR
jgi:hypothetical protein